MGYYEASHNYAPKTVKYALKIAKICTYKLQNMHLYTPKYLHQTLWLHKVVENYYKKIIRDLRFILGKLLSQIFFWENKVKKSFKQFFTLLGMIGHPQLRVSGRSKSPGYLWNDFCYVAKNCSIFCTVMWKLNYTVEHKLRKNSKICINCLKFPKYALLCIYLKIVKICISICEYANA